jgi:Na+-driven multidrug efflux pump
VQARRLLLGTCIGFGLAVGALFALLPKGLVGLFIDTGSEAAIIAIKGFPLLAVGILFFILNVAIIGYYQSVERVGKATFFVFLRGMIFIVPAFLLLPRFLGAEGIWLAMPVSEILTTCVILADRLKKSL